VELVEGEWSELEASLDELLEELLKGLSTKALGFAELI
jgi:hypothetical protein